MSYRNVQDNYAQERCVEYTQQKQFREITNALNLILDIYKLPHMKIARYHPDKRTITVANIKSPNLIIQLQYSKEKNKYIINSTMFLVGEFYYNDLMNLLNGKKRSLRYI